MPDVEINGHTVTIERFRLAKATRVMTLLQLLQKQVPEVSKSWATFRTEYARDYPRVIARMNALAMYGPQLEHISEDEWERTNQTFTVPGTPNAYEVFFHMAPLIYDQAEEVALRLLGLIALPNDTVRQYVKDGDIWKRVDEYVEEVIADAPLDEIMDLVIAAAEVIDGQLLQKAKALKDRAGNVVGLLGWKTTSEKQPTSPTSSEQPEPSSSTTSTGSPSDTSGTPTESATSPGTTSEPSATGSMLTA
jgi:hypothetical protein